MVPGADRKLREYQQHSKECLVRHSAASASQQYNFIAPDRPKYDSEFGPLLSKTPPDVCTMNKRFENSRVDLDNSVLMPAMSELNFPVGKSLMAGQTVPIKIKNHRSTTHHSNPLSYSNFPPNKYGTMPHSKTTTAQLGFLGVCDIDPASNSSACYSSKSKTLQHQRTRTKCVKIETFQSPDAGFTDCGKFGYSGSAV